MEGVISNLTILYTNNDPAAKGQANNWLQGFQKQPEAWATAGVILAAADAPQEPKLFAAQTFRSKITYDIHDLAVSDRLSLRDSLLSALKDPNNGSRVLTRQICLSLADLLLQLPEWNNAVPEMIETLGKTPETAPALLTFLTVLAEEAAENGRIDPTNNDVLTETNAGQVLNLLSVYIQAAGITAALRRQVFECLEAWLREGAVQSNMVAELPLFDAAFDALAGDELFDEATNIICTLVHETQELDDNVAAIQKIVPRLVTFNNLISTSIEDHDRMRGFAKILSEAGEWYIPLILQHQDTFMPIVQALAQCAQCEDLDIVAITFPFWWRLSKAVSKRPDDPANQTFLNVFLSLVDTIFNHLKYPEDIGSLLPQERDDFREFRHNIGDTLKDCCSVLGTNACLQRAFESMTSELGKGNNAQWQAIEAPLFAMRSMGARVDPKDNSILPQIMEVLSKLPAHPKIRYAAILVISRYTEWTNQHPEHIPFQLSYISAGFGDADQEVWLASSSALKYLCEDCQGHMIPYLPQLHTYLQDLDARLPPDDLLTISQGIAYIIAAMPTPDAIQSLTLFCNPLLEQVFRICSQPQVDKSQMKIAENALERLDGFLHICRLPPGSLPESCQKTCTDAWQVLDTIFAQHGHQRAVSESACAVVRRGMDFFYDLVLPIAPAIIQRMALCFESSGQSGYLWITSKLAPLASKQGGEAVYQSLALAFESESQKVFGVLQSQPVTSCSDLIEDYLLLLSAIYRGAPDLLFLSSNLPAILSVATSALSLVSPGAIRNATDFIIDVIGHESLSATPNVPKAAEYSTATRSAISQVGFQIVSALLLGLITEFEDTATTITSFRLFADRFSAEFVDWVPAALAQIPPKALSQSDRDSFLEKFNAAMSGGSLPAVRESFVVLDRVSRRAKSRAWAEEREARKLHMPALISATD